MREVLRKLHVPDHAQADRVNVVAIAVVDRFESALVAYLEGDDETLVGGGCVIRDALRLGAARLPPVYVYAKGKPADS